MLDSKKIIELESKYIRLVLNLKEIQYISERKLELLRDAARISKQVAELTEEYDKEIKQLPVEIKQLVHFIKEKKNGKL